MKNNDKDKIHFEVIFLVIFNLALFGVIADQLFDVDTTAPATASRMFFQNRP